MHLLLDQGKDATSSTGPNTVYTLRFRTAYGRTSGLSEPYAHVLVCLVGKDGTSVLRRVSPVNDPEANEAELLEICSVSPQTLASNQHHLVLSMGIVQLLCVSKCLLSI
jgi:hypothetical protein